MSDQPKMQVYPDGSKEWWLNGKRHRTDGPAIEWTGGSKMWFLNGNLVSWQEVYRQANDPEIELKILTAALS